MMTMLRCVAHPLTRNVSADVLHPAQDVMTEGRSRCVTANQVLRHFMTCNHQSLATIQ